MLKRENYFKEFSFEHKKFIKSFWPINTHLYSEKYLRSIENGGCDCVLEGDRDTELFVSNIRLVHYAAAEGNVEILKILADHGCDLNALTSHTKLTPLYIARNKRHINVIKFLLLHGADVNLLPQKSTNWSVLHEALEWGLCGIFQELLHSENVTNDLLNCRDRYGSNVGCSVYSTDFYTLSTNDYL